MDTNAERSGTPDGKNPCDTYFQTFCTSNKKIIPVNIASNSIFDIYVDNANKVDILTRKSMKFPTNEKFTIFSPSLPFDLPNKYKTITSKYFFREKLIAYGLHQWFYGFKQYQTLKIKHYKVFHESLLTDEGCNKLFDRFLHRLVKSPQYICDKYRLFQQTRKISDFISDIPLQCLTEILDETLLLECEEFEENYNLKNCLAQYKKNGRSVIFCPTGELMDYVAMKEILIDSDEINNLTIEFKMLKSMELLKVHVNYLIKEIVICGDETLHVRGNYQYHVYHIDLSETSCNLILIHKLSFDKMIHTIGVNFNAPNEIFVVAEDGAIFQFLDLPEPNKVIDNEFSKAVKWQTCIYGTSRETCLVSNEDEVIMYDFRMKNTIPYTYFDISSDYVNNTIEKLSPVLLWSPMNQHQYFISSNQTILINDERYLKTPVLQFNHYLNSPPYFIQTFSDILHADKKLLLAFGSYKSAESVLYQIFANGIKEVSFGNSEKLKCKNPIAVTQPLYKLSNYCDWKTYLTDWKLSLSFANRLSQPCIGINLIPLTSITNDNNKYFTVIQQSLCGDLFFQQILSSFNDVDISGNKYMSDNIFMTETMFEKVLLTERTQDNDITMIETCKRRCKQWMDTMVEKIKIDDDITENMEDTINDSICTTKQLDDDKLGYYEEIDKFVTCICDTFEYSNNPNDNPTVRTDNVYDLLNDARKINICQLKNNENTQNDLHCFCDKCSVVWHNKLSKLKDEGKIVTRKSLGLPQIEELPSELLELVNDLKYGDRPMNQVLTTQWQEKKYTPLDVFAPNVTFVKEGD